MGIFNFIKNLLKEETKTGSETVVTLETLPNWISEQKAEIKEKEKTKIEIIKNLISQTIKELEEKQKALDEVTLEKRKEDEKLKHLVLENRKSYSESLTVLMEKLQVVDGESLEELTLNIDKILSDFQQRAHLNYEKATVLIGKEMAETKETINKFFKELKEMDNGTLIKKSKTLDRAEKKLEEIKEEQKLISDLQSANDAEKKLKDAEEKEKSLKNKLEQTKNSEDYKQKQLQLEEAEKNRIKFDEELLQLKNEIGFKSLANIYHSDTKKMRIVRHYGDNFSHVLENHADLLEIIDDSIKEKVENKIFELHKRNKEITRILSQSDLIEEIQREIQTTQNEITALNQEKQKQEKIISKFNENISRMQEEIKNSLKEIGIEIK